MAGYIDEDTVAQGTVVVSVGTGERSGALSVYPVIGDEVWGGMRDATLPAEPLAVLALVVVPVERQTVAVRTEWISLLVIPTFSEIPDRGQASEGILVAGVVTDLDRAQGVESVADKE